MRRSPQLDGVSETFAQIDLHDWELLEVVVRYVSGTEEAHSHEVLLRVGEPATLEGTPQRKYRIIFSRVRGFRAEMDLVAKAYCSNAISSNLHRPVAEDSDFVDKLDEDFLLLSPRLPERNRLIDFRIPLVEPGGSLEILAETVEMTEITGATTL
jgi:succinate dehydrogenase flavin-adding protein (antitoxin of CptAB toxin-antitoxin module)